MPGAMLAKFALRMARAGGAPARGRLRSRSAALQVDGGANFLGTLPQGKRERTAPDALRPMFAGGGVSHSGSANASERVPHVQPQGNPATRNRTRDHLIAAVIYSQMLYQLSYSRWCRRLALNVARRMIFSRSERSSSLLPRSDASATGRCCVQALRGLRPLPRRHCRHKLHGPALESDGHARCSITPKHRNTNTAAGAHSRRGTTTSKGIRAAGSRAHATTRPQNRGTTLKQLVRFYSHPNMEHSGARCAQATEEQDSSPTSPHTRNLYKRWRLENQKKSFSAARKQTTKVSVGISVHFVRATF